MKQILVCLSCALLVCACTSKPPAQVEQPIQQGAANTLLPKVGRGISRPASAREVATTLRRVFADGVVPDQNTCSFITGDFNGDDSVDLAVLVHPVRTRLGMLNSDVANWTIQDADHFFTPSASQRVIFRAKAARVVVHSNDLLLAVIHGFGEEGWRDQRARQAYLVRHAGAAPLRSARAHGSIENAPASLEHSDVVYDGSRHSSFLFWTGSQYAWASKAQSKGEQLDKPL